MDQGLRCVKIPTRLFSHLVLFLPCNDWECTRKSGRKAQLLGACPALMENAIVYL